MERARTEIARIKGIRHAYIGSGIRYDLFLDEKGFVDETSYPYLKELILEHTSGRLKVAPEHTEDAVLKLMAKPSFKLFERLRREFDNIVRSSGRKCELVPYFISGHPGCGMREMKRLASTPALRGLYILLARARLIVMISVHARPQRAALKNALARPPKEK